MGLFSNPVVINDGTARSFEARSTYIDKRGAMTGEYFETAAAASINSAMLVRQSKSTAGGRHANIRVSQLCTTTDGKLEEIAANFTISFKTTHTQADVEMMVKRLNAALTITGTSTGIVVGRV